MIDQALGVIAGQLNQGLRRALSLREDLVVLGNLHEQDGQVSAEVDNKLVVSLVNIARDTVTHRAPRAGGGGLAGRLVQTPTPVYLTLSVLFAANFSSANYAEALKFVSATVGFFQSQPVFDRRSTPELGPGIDRLVLDMQNLNFTELSNLWGILSGRYLPSVLYQVRMVAVDLNQISGQAHTVRDARASVAG